MIFFRLEYFAPDQNILHYSPDWNILQYAPYQTILYYFPDQNILYYSLDLNILHHSPDSLRSRPEPERYLEIEDGNLPQGLNPLYTAVRWVERAGCRWYLHKQFTLTNPHQFSSVWRPMHTSGLGISCTVKQWQLRPFPFYSLFCLYRHPPSVGVRVGSLPRFHLNKV